VNEGARSQMGAAFSADFSSVRVHTGSAADGVASRLHANALTAGTDILFRSGAYTPGTQSGDRLLAHELAHVVQQAGGLARAPIDGGPSDRLERAADVAADDVVRTVRSESAPAGANPGSVNGKVRSDAAAQQPSAGRNAVPIQHESGAARPLQRFTGPEHATIGNATGVQIDLGDGVVLDWGQVVAIAGDEVGTEDELRAWVGTTVGKQKILAALNNAEVPGDAVRMLPAPTPEQKEEQETRYHLLLLDNVSHFAAGGSALNTWREHHVRALTTALRLGLANPVSTTTELNNAYITEAFGQHYLSDMFSGGHIRTPRGEIAEWYVDTFAPKVIDSMILNLRQRLEDGIYRQVSAQSNMAWFFEGTAREKIRATLDDMIAKNIAKLKGGRQELTEYLGKAMAGIISGAIHDVEGRRGVMVASQAHPDPWKAMGDSRLEENDTVNKEMAQAAVVAGLDDVNRAFAIGQREGVFKELIPPPTTLPSRIFFKFNSEAVPGSAVASLDGAAAYLAYNPDSHLELVGLTDPIGTDDYNDALGMRRAEAIGARILAHGVASSQVELSSLGERQPATLDPRQYARNRRVEFIWTDRLASATPTGGTQDDAAIAFQRAQQAVLDEIGPPFTAVERFIPAEIPGANPDLPDWRWGKMSYWRWDTMSPGLKVDIKDWVSRRFTKKLQEKLLGSDMLKKQKIDDIEVDPRPIVDEMLEEIKTDPTKFLDGLFSPYPGPPDFSPD
jgi:outer membrane protein OmpA-like peptidoglycan-associated protein